MTHRELDARWASLGGFGEHNVRSTARDRLATWSRSVVMHARLREMFGFESDHSTKLKVEYLWGFDAIPLGSGGVVVDAGGGASGL